MQFNIDSTSHTGKSHEAVPEKNTAKPQPHFKALSQAVSSLAQSTLSSLFSSKAIQQPKPEGLYPENLWASLKNSNLYAPIFTGRTAFLPEETRSTLKLSSNYSYTTLKKIGLLRSPSSDEAKIKDFEYNLSMAKESLILGRHLKNEGLANRPINFQQLWKACRAWRVGRIDISYRYGTKLVENFSTVRAEVKNVPYFVTQIEKKDERYNHILERLSTRAIAGENSQSCQTKKVLTNRNEEITLVSVQYSTVIQGKRIPLTSLRTALNSKNQVFPNPWAHGNSGKLEMSDPLFQNFHNKKNVVLVEGIMIHTDVAYIPLLEQEIQKLSTQFSSLSKNVKLNSSSLTTPESKVFLNILADIHYLLSHTMIDNRGSAAKSELYIRAIAVSAGLELPPFKKGFVPDLEAFMTSRENFIQNYSNAFEHTTTLSMT